MDKRVLITGGAGFIGSHLADHLLAHGYTVRALDSLDPQVHGTDPEPPDYLSSEVELLPGDVRDPTAVRRALTGVDAVFHLAARVGVGQSMYQIADYMGVNGGGTAVLLEALLDRPVERLIVASSMSVYGEGLYRNAEGRLREPGERPIDRLREKRWELEDPAGATLLPLPTPESKTPRPSSVYALSKYDQERLALMVGAAYDLPTVALRFFNVYGARQALSNPYTGVLAIFAARYLNGKPPLVFEDGRQQRDFVSVQDVVQACRLALEAEGSPGGVFNVGSGRACTVLEVAAEMARVLGCEHIAPEVTGTVRVGDIRHCFADITRAREVLGYSPQHSLATGLVELADWLAGQMADDRVEAAGAELARRGLAV